MQPAPLHPHESERIKTLHSFDILDTEGEHAYDELTRLVSEIAGTEIALVSLIDEDRQWFKSRHGLDAAETPRDLAFCAHAILTPDLPFVVEDASKDDRFSDNPLVTSNPSIRFYAGIPLRSPFNNMPLGTLCAISPRVMSLSREKIDQLTILGRQVERLLALRRVNSELRIRTSLLDKTRAEAQRANEAKTRFLATISHDMRTPLNGLVGTLGMLDEILTEQNQHDLAKTAESCAKVLLQLVNDTLDLSKIESGTIELATEPFSPAKVVTETVGVVDVTLKEKPVEIKTIIDPKMPKLLKGDDLRCRKVILNLLSNAAKFTKNGLIVIESRYSSGFWTIEVTDTGDGIPESDLQSIFEPYTQSDSGIKNPNGGAGLGLNICKGICERLGGGVTVSSKLGMGSTFTATMKLPSAESRRRTEDRAPVEIPDLSVLIAEDDRISREILAAQLRRIGCTVESAADGDEALLKLRNGSFDIAILDYNMPGKNGPEVAAAYRVTENGGSRLPIIALTARGFEEDRLKCEKAGMEMMVTKPVDTGELKRILFTVAVNKPAYSQKQPAVLTDRPSPGR